MNYLTVENIAKSYGELQLFEDISFSIHKDQKIALIAKNGTGKISQFWLYICMYGNRMMQMYVKVLCT